MLENVTKIICDVMNLELGEIDITPDTSFKNDLGMDSLSAVELAMAIEDEYEIEVSDTAAEKFVVVSDLIDYIMTQI